MLEIDGSCISLKSIEMYHDGPLPYHFIGDDEIDKMLNNKDENFDSYEPSIFYSFSFDPKKIEASRKDLPRRLKEKRNIELKRICYFIKRIKNGEKIDQIVGAEIDEYDGFEITHNYSLFRAYQYCNVKTIELDIMYD